MSTWSGSSSASGTVRTRSPSPRRDVPGHHHGGVRRPVLQQHLAGLADLPGAAAGTGVVEGEHQVRRRRGAQPAGDDLPGLEAVGEGEHGVVVAQRRPHAGGRRVGGRHPGQHPYRDLRVRVLLGRLQHGRRHGEHAGVPAGDDGHPRARAVPVPGRTPRARPPPGCPSRAAAARPGAAPGPDRSCTRPRRRRPASAPRVSGVSHSGPAGPVPTTTTSPGGVLAALAGRRADLARQHGDGEVRHGLRVHVRDPPGALALHRGALHVAGLGQPSRPLQRPAHLGERAPQLHHGHRVAGRRAGRSTPPRAGCRAAPSAPPRPPTAGCRAGRLPRSRR